MDPVKRHFDSEAKEFDGIIVRLIPHYPTMLRALVEAVPFEKTKPIRVLDLGCGTGTLSRLLAETFPNARLTCLDAAPKMIEMCRRKMADRAETVFVPADFSRYGFPAGTFDLVVSSLALHHLEGDRKKLAMYRKIFNSLRENGWFFNADSVLGSTPHFDRLYLDRWVEYMRQNVSEESIQNEWLKRYESEDFPAPLGHHLRWLGKIGFDNVEVVWKYFGFAVFGGRKPETAKKVPRFLQRAEAKTVSPTTETIPASVLSLTPAS